MRDPLTTPLPVDGHAPHANRRNDTERQSKAASLCNNSLVFLCVEAFTITTVSGLLSWVRNWLVKLLIDYDWMMKLVFHELTLLVVLLVPGCWAQGKCNCISYIERWVGCTMQKVVHALFSAPIKGNSIEGLNNFYVIDKPQ